MPSENLERKTFLLLLSVVTLAFGAVLLPFYGAVFWGVVLAILFAPLQRRLLRKMPGRANLAALATLGLCMLIVILPLTLISASLIQEATQIYQKIKDGQLNFTVYFQQVLGMLPQWALNLLSRFGLDDLPGLQRRLAEIAASGSQFIATQALQIGQNTFQFLINFAIMLYLLFFLLRDGPALAGRIRRAIPLEPAHKQNLFNKFATVIRATVKGNIAVAATQGALGGIIFALLGIEGSVLWGVVMAFLSLLPAVGAGLIWLPVAVYFLATGSIWQGVVLISYGILVIGLVDNVLRPLLVGKDTKMPDYLVLISTLGGMALFGINGFVIGPAIAALFVAVWDLFSSSDESPSA